MQRKLKWMTGEVFAEEEIGPEGQSGTVRQARGGGDRVVNHEQDDNCSAGTRCEPFIGFTYASCWAGYKVTSCFLRWSGLMLNYYPNVSCSH